ncbi:hypothetical protein BCR36DRAFT_579958 [Piromyces finnis]|uniref:Uncharacterized protein n=1 Tax=Piromyces finnis TaxID=1754191 RepID=A0A1Y1VJS4_9FUNG|nr:hypothetical protein BCR36DRAFT_579958 [Piromyces finnis]|eukprot:ORX58340.1 hypothetical protein BCR36DRAFT_579958 [Piromyces finnis]
MSQKRKCYDSEEEGYVDYIRGRRVKVHTLCEEIDDDSHSNSINSCNFYHNQKNDCSSNFNSDNISNCKDIKYIFKLFNN